MKNIEEAWIKLKESINQEDYHLINQLQDECNSKEEVALKLELEYKLAIPDKKDIKSSIENTNEFMYFQGNKLIGYMGISQFGGVERPLEVNGMVSPEYRGQGIFKSLYKLILAEFNQRNTESMLLLFDRKSNEGENFIKTAGAQYKHTEYEMYLKEDAFTHSKIQLSGITLRKATNEDAREITRQNRIYFKDESQDLINTCNNEEDIILEEDMILPEDEEKRGVIIYIAEKNQEIIGKVHLEVTSSIGGIYGLGVLPEHRSKGYGRNILIMAIEKLKEANVKEIMLQVASENANALNLYKSCGFVETSTMDYYEIKKTKRYRDWFDISLKDLKGAQILYEHDADYGIVCFHYQQALEKYLKGYLILKEGVLQEGHSLIKLCKKAVRFNEGFKAYVKDCAFVNTFYIETRYPAEEPLIVSEEDVNECLKIVEDMINFINEIIK